MGEVFKKFKSCTEKADNEEEIEACKKEFEEKARFDKEISAIEKRFGNYKEEPSPIRIGKLEGDMIGSTKTTSETIRDVEVPESYKKKGVASTPWRDIEVPEKITIDSELAKENPEEAERVLIHELLEWRLDEKRSDFETINGKPIRVTHKWASKYDDEILEDIEERLNL